MSSVKRAVLMSAVGQYSLQIINFVTVAVIARLLSPEEIGLFAVATSISFVANEIRSFGVAEFLVREKEVTDDKIRRVLGVMVIMSWGLGLLFLIGAGWAADFYNEADLMPLLWIISVPFFFAPHSAVPVALITRNMNFDALLRVNLVGCFGRSGISIALVLMGYSYFGLAWGTLTGVVLEFLMITYYRPAGTPWLPVFKNLKQIFKVGVPISMAKFLGTISQNSTDLLLGRMANMHAVGMFSRGFGLIMFLQSLLTKAVAPVSLPHLAEVSRSGGSVKDAYLKSIVLVGAVTIPVFAVVNLAAEEMISTLFGDQWLDAIAIASILSWWMILQTIHCFINSVFLTEHQENYFLAKEIASIILRVGIILLMIPHGLIYVAWGFVLSGVLEFIVISYLVNKSIGLSMFETLRAFASNFSVALMCWLVLKSMYLGGIFDGMNSLIALVIIGSSMIPVWLLAIKFTRNPLWPLLLTIIERVLTKRSPA